MEASVRKEHQTPVWHDKRRLSRCYPKERTPKISASMITGKMITGKNCCRQQCLEK